MNESDTDPKVYEADLEGTLSNGHIVSKHFTITQQPRVKKTATATATFSNQNFSTTNLSATVDDITVEFSMINGSTGTGIAINQRQSSTLTFTPVSSTEHMNVTITGITMTFYSTGYYNPTYYNPDTITGPFTGGTTATYNGGNTTSPVSTTLTARNNRQTRITSIEVNYTYEYYE